MSPQAKQLLIQHQGRGSLSEREGDKEVNLGRVGRMEEKQTSTRKDCVLGIKGFTSFFRKAGMGGFEAIVLFLFFIYCSCFDVC